MMFRSARRSDRGVWGRVLLALGAALWLSLAGRALAQSGDALELTWRAPKGCPDGHDVRSRVLKLADATHADIAPLQAEATIVQEPSGELHLHLVIHAEQLVGERNIRGKSCRDLAGAAAVALALLLRSAAPLTAADLMGTSPSSTSQPTRPSPTPDAPDRPTDAAAPPATGAGSAATQASPAAPRPPRTWRGLLQLPLLMLGVGPLHRPSYGLGIGAGMSLGPWLWLAEGRAWLPQQTSKEIEGQRYHADVQRFAGGLRGCRAFVWARFQLAPCLAVSAEHLSARGGGAYVAAKRAKTTWIAVGFGLQARVRLAAWLQLVAGVELQVQSSRPLIAVDDVGVIEQLLPVAAGFTLGPEWNL